MRSKLRWLTPLALGFALAPAPSVAQVRSPRHGVVSARGLADDPCRRSDLAALGTGWVRVSYDWDEMERTQGVIDWEFADRLVSSLTSLGLNIYWDFSYAPSWANGGLSRNYPPNNQQDLYNFVYAVVRRYGFERNQVKYWGHWNEVNLDQYYASGVSHFVTHELPTTINAIRAADPGAQIVVGELATAGSVTAVGLELSAILSVAGGAASVVSQHVYGNGDNCTGRLTFLDAIRDRLAERGYGHLPMWVTETGLDRAEGEKSYYLTCFMRGMDMRPWLQKTFWYRYENERTGSYSTGLLDGGNDPCTYTPNKTYYTYQAFIRGPCNHNGFCDPGEVDSCLDDCPADPCNNNGVCDSGEDATNCPNDCPCNNNGVCDSGESVTNCPNDCRPCNNNGHCDRVSGENDENCPHDCGVTTWQCNHNGVCDSFETVVDVNGNWRTTCPEDCPPCTAIGGDYCSPFGSQSCPAGYASLGTTYDCHPCCQYQGGCVSTGCPANTCGSQTDNCGSSVFCGDCCQASNWVCDTCEDCRENCSLDLCFPDCTPYACNCRDEPYSYPCPP